MVQPDSSTTFLDSCTFLCLSSEQLEALNWPFSALEIDKAIDSLPNNKSPGSDGFVGEY